MDAALGVSGTASAPATASASAPTAASNPADRDLLDKAASSQPGEQVYVDGKWVSVAATQSGAAAGESGNGAVANSPVLRKPPRRRQAPRRPPARHRLIRRVFRRALFVFLFLPLLEGVSKYNIIVRPGDIIRVPPIDPGEFYLMGHVGRPGVYTLTGRKVTCFQDGDRGGWQS